MNLSSKEKRFYENVLTKLKGDNQALNERNCFKLIERGVDDLETCNKVINPWNSYLISQDQRKNIQ